MTSDYFAEAEKKRREEAKEKAQTEFHKWSGYLSLNEYGLRVAVKQRVEDALRAVHRWRQVSNTGQNQTSEDAIVAARVAAETFADQITAAAGDGQDTATVAWVVAGLRCRAQPFCTGCTSCQTVTAPLRPAARLRGLW